MGFCALAKTIASCSPCAVKNMAAQVLVVD